VGSLPSFKDILDQVKREIVEIEPRAAAALSGEAVFLDVREPEEFAQGAVPGAVHLPRGRLELDVEARIPDKGRRIVVYCAGGTRSALAASTLSSLGYTQVASMAGGFTRWKAEGLSWAMPRVLDSDKRLRYGRHMLLPGIGEEGQQRLLASKVLVLGAGGLGSPAALYLAAAGVGKLGVVDMDIVDPSNLSRQILHNVDRIGARKVDSAKRTLQAMNPDVDVVTYDERLGADNVLEIFDSYDVIVDGTDNFPTRYLVNDASLVKKIPVVHGSIYRYEGRATVFFPYQGPCYRCLVPEPPPAELAPSCAEVGVLGVLPGIIGSIEAVEAIKLLLKLGRPLVGRLLAYDALEQSFTTFNIRRDPDCPACGEKAGEIVIAEYDSACLPHPSKAPKHSPHALER
jgi:molybdopterin/thiamine biosynthesis adenylyltransferase/rhodanese-related sulfurtransferase